MGNLIHSFKKFQFLASLIIVLLIVPSTGLACMGTAQVRAAANPGNASNITATMDDSNSLIFHIKGSVGTPGNVTVEYWNDGLQPLITESVSTDANNAFSTEIMRLRPSTQYIYQVYLTEPSKNSVLQYQGTFTTGPLPAGLRDAKIQLIQGTPTYDLVLMDYNCTNFNGIVAIDGGDQIVWYCQNDKQVFTVSQENNHNIVFNEISLTDGYTMKEIAPDGATIHTIDDMLQNGSKCAPHGRWHHEMLVRPDNKIWTLGEEIRSVIINGKNTLQTGSTIEEWDPTKGTVTRLASLFDLLDPVTNRGVDSDATTGFFWQGCQNQYAGVAEDWTHSNSLDVLPNGDILVSSRHLNQIIAIKPDFSGIDWKLGGVGSDFSFPNPADQFYHQHYVNMLPNGDLLLFDNGNLRPQDQGGQYSRAIELKLDFTTMQAIKVWEYRSTPDLYASAVGSACRLSNGNTLVDFGYDDVDQSPVFTLVEANAQGNPVAITKISSPGKNTQYRAIPIESLNGEATSTITPGQ
jgi:hypothetical protein